MIEYRVQRIESQCNGSWWVVAERLHDGDVSGKPRVTYVAAHRSRVEAIEEARNFAGDSVIVEDPAIAGETQYTSAEALAFFGETREEPAWYAHARRLIGPSFDVPLTAEEIAQIEERTMYIAIWNENCVLAGRHNDDVEIVGGKAIADDGHECGDVTVHEVSPQSIANVETAAKHSSGGHARFLRQVADTLRDCEGA